MGNNTQSVDKKNTTGRTAADDIHDEVVKEMEKKIEDVAKTVAESVLPPGVHIPRRNP